MPRPYEWPNGITARFMSDLRMPIVAQICRPSAIIWPCVKEKALGSPMLPLVTFIRQISLLRTRPDG